jgi:hypothetical protein
VNWNKGLAIAEKACEKRCECNKINSLEIGENRCVGLKNGGFLRLRKNCVFSKNMLEGLCINHLPMGRKLQVLHFRPVSRPRDGYNRALWMVVLA